MSTILVSWVFGEASVANASALPARSPQVGTRLRDSCTVP